MRAKYSLGPLVLILAILWACNLAPAPTATLPPAVSPSAPAPPPATGPSRPSAPGRTFYVAPHGDNSNPGTREQPWATPGYGSRQLAPGDTLIILGGRYTLSEYDADIITPPSGTAQAWATIRGEEGNRPVLAGRDNLATAVNLAGAQYVRIQSLEITHDDQAQGEAAWFREDGDPRFVRPAWGEAGDYHLHEGSPAIDAGAADGAPTVDLENRPRDARPDIGAYELRRPTSRLYLPLVM